MIAHFAASEPGQQFQMIDNYDLRKSIESIVSRKLFNNNLAAKLVSFLKKF